MVKKSKLKSDRAMQNHAYKCHISVCEGGKEWGQRSIIEVHKKRSKEQCMYQRLGMWHSLFWIIIF